MLTTNTGREEEERRDAGSRDRWMVWLEGEMERRRLRGEWEWKGGEHGQGVVRIANGSRGSGRKWCRGSGGQR
jgi:hypothetical protein